MNDAPGPLSSAHVVTKLPAQDLERADGSTQTCFGLEPLEERGGGLRYLCGGTEFHLFESSAPRPAPRRRPASRSTTSTRRSRTARRALRFERFDIPGFDARGDVVVVPNNYPSKGTGELGAFFRDSEGNLLAMDRRPADRPPGGPGNRANVARVPSPIGVVVGGGYLKGFVPFRECLLTENANAVRLVNVLPGPTTTDGQRFWPMWLGASG